MFTRRTLSVAIFACYCLSGLAARGQTPELQYLHPAGGTRGRTIEVELVGKRLDDLTSLHFSCAPADVPKIAAKLLGKNRAELTIAADAPLGDFDAWAVGPKGMSAPVRFAVGELPVVVEAEPNNATEKAQVVEAKSVVFGRIEPGTDTDWFRVNVPKGANLAVVCRSPSLGGTVLPTIGVFIRSENGEWAHDSLMRTEPQLIAPWDEAGEFLVRVQDRSYRTTPAPFYELTLTTGPLLLGIYPPTFPAATIGKGTLYGYNLSKNQIDNVTSTGGAFPGDIITKLDVELNGSAAAPSQAWRSSAAIFSNLPEHRKPSFVGDASFESSLGTVIDAADPEPKHNPYGREEDERHRKSLEPRQLETPVTLTNRFARSRDTVHWYRFMANKDQYFFFEAAAQQLGRPCDLELVVHDAQRKPLETLNDVAFAKGAEPIVPLESRDPAGTWKAPADGEYLLAVHDRNAFNLHSFERAYRLSIGPRLEDVRVVAVMGDAAAPRGWSMPASGKLEITVGAVRRGGHGAAIEIAPVEGSLPAGLKIAPVTIAAGKPSATLTIEATKDAVPAIIPIRLTAKTMIEGKPRTVAVATVVYVPGETKPAARICAEPIVAVLGNSKK
jgi:hypothetical protein